MLNQHFFLATAISFTLAVGVWTYPAIAAELDETTVKLFNLQKAVVKRDPTPQAQYSLAQMYELGLGTEENLNKARELYQRAADQGYTVAKLQLKEVDRAMKEAELDRQHAAKAQVKTGNAVVPSATEEETAEAKRRAEREKARADRKRKAMAALRKAQAAAKAGNPFGDE